jgi:hypothetical protein
MSKLRATTTFLWRKCGKETTKIHFDANNNNNNNNNRSSNQGWENRNKMATISSNVFRENVFLKVFGNLENCLFCSLEIGLLWLKHLAMKQETLYSFLKFEPSINYSAYTISNISTSKMNLAGVIFLPELNKTSLRVI